MHKHRIFAESKVAMLVMVLIGLLCSLSAAAQSGDGYELARSTAVSSYLASAGGYTLNAAAGQAEAQGWSSSGYTLFGGFWGGGRIIRMHRIYLPFTAHIIIQYPGSNSGE